MLSEFTKMFTQQEMKKLKSAYTNRSILEIIETFRVNCEVIKTNILDTKWDTESKLIDVFIYKFYLFPFPILICY